MLVRAGPPVGACRSRAPQPRNPTNQRASKHAKSSLTHFTLGDNLLDSHRYRGHGSIGLATGLKHPGPELGAVFAPRHSLRFHSVHLFGSWTLCLPALSPFSRWHGQPLTMKQRRRSLCITVVTLKPRKRRHHDRRITNWSCRVLSRLKCRGLDKFAECVPKSPDLRRPDGTTSDRQQARTSR